MDEEPSLSLAPLRFDWPTREHWAVMIAACLGAIAMTFAIPNSNRQINPPLLTVSSLGEYSPTTIRSSTQSFNPTPPINPNAADLDALDALPGIGPVLGKRIIDARADGPFTSPEDIERRVRGIGPKTLERIRPFLRFDPPPPSPPLDEARGSE